MGVGRNPLPFLRSRMPVDFLTLFRADPQGQSGDGSGLVMLGALQSHPHQAPCNCAEHWPSPEESTMLQVIWSDRWSHLSTFCDRRVVLTALGSSGINPVWQSSQGDVLSSLFFTAHKLSIRRSPCWCFARYAIYLYLQLKQCLKKKSFLSLKEQVLESVFLLILIHRQGCTCRFTFDCVGQRANWHEQKDWPISG